MAETIRAFMLGVYEFRRSMTTHFDEYRLADCYDMGREAAHRLTLRRLES